MIESMKLTEHFTRKELECPCCGIFTMKPDFVFMLERIRKEVDEPMHVESGQRCLRKNTKLKKAASQSPHLSGEAVDITCRSDRLRGKLTAAAIKHGATGIGQYEGHVHIDVKKREGVVPGVPTMWWGTY